MKLQAPWLRVFVEGVVIVGSMKSCNTTREVGRSSLPRPIVGEAECLVTRAVAFGLVNPYRVRRPQRNPEAVG